VTEPGIIEQVGVLSNERLTEGIGLLTLEAPRIAETVEPGQFVHLRITEGADFILRRPFSVHRARAGRIEILYQVVGLGTRALSEKTVGSEMDAIGPLGTGFTLFDGVSHALVVAGGLGAAPMGMLVERLAQKGIATTFAFGAPNRERLVRLDMFGEIVRRVEVSTDDGSIGVHGLVTEVVERVIRDDAPDVIYVCGPEAMARAVAKQAERVGIKCQVSLERLMACGVGACLSCVVSTKDGLKRACVDGPVFDAAQVLWDVSEIPPRH